MDLLAALQPTSPVIVRIVEPEKKGWTDVLYSALGLTGVLVVVAVVLAIAFAAILFWVRSR